MARHDYFRENYIGNTTVTTQTPKLAAYLAFAAGINKAIDENRYTTIPVSPTDACNVSEAYCTMMQALRDIAGGCFPEASTLAVGGDWQAMYIALQNLALNALLRVGEK